jgi:tRNA modification GTPase
MKYPADTIAAVATPPGQGGVGIIRISGPDALPFAENIFRPATKESLTQGSWTRGAGIKERYLYYGRIIDPTTAAPSASPAVIDDGFLVFMKGPRSYTGEDVFELHCHGGPLVLQKVLGVVLRCGARIAEPGEFTKRAFLNGKLDLAQAEAVCDLIRASTEGALTSARGRIEGRLSKRVRDIKEVLFGLLTRVEAELDFPEDDVDELPAQELLNGLVHAGEDLKMLISTYDQGRALSHGVRVLILGRPNVGKSSLLNILLKEERAIVTELPGTTRDLIEEVVIIKGLPIRLMDTAGLTRTLDPVEAKGVSIAKERLGFAQLVLFVIDSSAGDFKEDLEHVKAASGKKIIIVANKLDLVDGKKLDEIKKVFGGFHVVFISALKEKGIDGLEEAAYEKTVGRPYGVGFEADPGEYVASAWQKEALTKALDGIERVKKAVRDGLTRDLIATDLRWTVDRLGEITGETTTEDILERIFSDFCIGK